MDAVFLLNASLQELQAKLPRLTGDLEDVLLYERMCTILISKNIFSFRLYFNCFVLPFVRKYRLSVPVPGGWFITISATSGFANIVKLSAHQYYSPLINIKNVFFRDEALPVIGEGILPLLCLM